MWRLESKTCLHGDPISWTKLDRGLSSEKILELGEALNSNEVELHGNYMWHPATWIYAPKLKDLDKKTGYIRQAIDVLNELELPPLEKAHQIIEIPHFGRNIATGLVMVFHPTEFAIYSGYHSS